MISSPVVVRGQWGQGMDDYGRKFTNSNEDYFRTDLVSNHYPARNPNLVLSFRPGSAAVIRSRTDIDAVGLDVVPVPGNEGLLQRLRDAHAEIRPGPGLSRPQFKQALRSLE